MPAPASTKERAPGDGHLVLWAASSHIGERDTQVELRRRGVRVETAPTEALVDKAHERAPDLIVLGGEQGLSPEPFVEKLALAAPSIPLVTLVPTERAAPRPRARYGLIAKLDRSLAPPALAAQITNFLSDFSARAPVWRIKARAGDLPRLAARFAQAGRAGILATEGGAIAIEAGFGVTPPSLDLAPGSTDGTLTVLFHERPFGRVRTRSLPGRDGPLEGARVLVVDDALERRNRAQQRLEAAGATVQAIELTTRAIHESRALDPSVVVVAASAMRSSALAPLWREPRLAPASLLVLDASELESDALPATVAALVEPELSLGRRLRAKEAVAARLETFGPARWLKLLGPCTHDVTLRVFAAAGRGRVDLAGGRIQGASFRPRKEGAAVVEGRPAVDALMALQFGRVLAGPPDALAALDGASARRKPSAVGRIEPLPAPTLRRGLVAKEEVVQHTDLSSVAVPKPAPLPKTASPPPVVFSDLADGPDYETRNYAPETLEALRKELEATDDANASAESERAAPDEAERATVERTSTPPRDEPADATAADAEGEKAAEDKDAARPEERAETRAAEAQASPSGPSPALPTPTPSPPSAESPPAEAPSPLEPAASFAGDTAGLHSPDAVTTDASERDEQRRPPNPQPTRASAEHIDETDKEASPVDIDAEPPRRGKAIGLAAAFALAIGGGGWAAWHLQAEPSDVEGTARIASPPRTEPQAETPNLRGEAETPDEPRSDEGAQSDEALAPAALSAEPAESDADSTELAVQDTRASEPPADAEPSNGESAEHTEPEDEALGDASVGELIRLAREAIRDGDYARSERLSRRALELSPRDPRAGYRLAVALFRLERDREAIAQCELTSRWDPDDPLPLALIGDIHGRRGRFRLAARAYRRALEADPQFEPAQRALARLARRGIQ